MADNSQTASLFTRPAERPREDTRTRLRRFFQRYPPLVIIAALWLLFMIFVAVSAPLISPYEYSAIDLRARLQAPAGMEGGDWKHVFGTDDLGRDVLSRLIFSIRLSLLVAFLGTIIGAILGTALGFLAAHFRGWVDDVVMAAIDFQAALPIPLWRSNASSCGLRPRKAMNASMMSRLPPISSISSRNRIAVGGSNRPLSSNAENASAARTSAHL